MAITRAMLLAVVLGLAAPALLAQDDKTEYAIVRAADLKVLIAEYLRLKALEAALKPGSGCI